MPDSVAAELPRARERDRYMNCLTKEAVPESRRADYVCRVRQFIRELNGRGPTALDEHEIGALLDSLDRRDDFSG